MSASIPKSVILRIGKSIGVKSISDDGVDFLKSQLCSDLEELISIIMLSKKEHGSKTVMIENLYDAMYFSNQNLVNLNRLNLPSKFKPKLPEENEQTVKE